MRAVGWLRPNVVVLDIQLPDPGQAGGAPHPSRAREVSEPRQPARDADGQGLGRGPGLAGLDVARPASRRRPPAIAPPEASGARPRPRPGGALAERAARWPSRSHWQDEWLTPPGPKPPASIGLERRRLSTGASWIRMATRRNGLNGIRRLGRPVIIRWRRVRVGTAPTLGLAGYCLLRAHPGSYGAS